MYLHKLIIQHCVLMANSFILHLLDVQQDYFEIQVS